MTKYLQGLEKDYYVYHLNKARSIRDAAVNRMEMAPSTLRDKLDFYEIVFKTTDSNQNEETKGNINEQEL